MKNNFIFNIQRYSLHDGGGIRTIIFFKGCNLKCPWCSNPESQSFEQELFKRESLCIKCNGSNCHSCTIVPEQCPTGALEIVGTEMSLDEIIHEVKKDMIFYESTSGGVTLSGGEPLCQGEFIVDLLKGLKALGIHTAIETAGFSKWEVLDKASDYLDLVLFDLKIMDRKKCLKIVNADMDVVKDNFMRLTEKGVNIIPRIPLIPDFTMDEDNIEAISDFVSSQGLKEIHLLPFHQFGSSKYDSLDRKYELENITPPTDEEIENIKKYMEKRNLYVIIGGK